MSKKVRPEFVDVLIQDVPFDVYLDMRAKLLKKGYYVKAYQKDFYQG